MNEYRITLSAEQDAGVTKARLFDNAQKPHLPQIQTNAEYIQQAISRAADSYIAMIPDQA